MTIQLPHNFFSPRGAKRQENHNKLIEQLLLFVSAQSEEKDAETLWLAMQATENMMSQSTFNKRLKVLIEAGLINKRAIGYNKYLYKAAEK